MSGSQTPKKFPLLAEFSSEYRADIPAEIIKEVERYISTNDVDAAQTWTHAKRLMWAAKDDYYTNAFEGLLDHRIATMKNAIEAKKVELGELLAEKLQLEDHYAFPYPKRDPVTMIWELAGKTGHGSPLQLYKTWLWGTSGPPIKMPNNPDKEIIERPLALARFEALAQYHKEDTGDDVQFTDEDFVNLWDDTKKAITRAFHEHSHITLTAEDMVIATQKSFAKYEELLSPTSWKNKMTSPFAKNRIVEKSRELALQTWDSLRQAFILLAYVEHHKDIEALANARGADLVDPIAAADRCVTREAGLVVTEEIITAEINKLKRGDEDAAPFESVAALWLMVMARYSVTHSPDEGYLQSLVGNWQLPLPAVVMGVDEAPGEKTMRQFLGM